MEFHLHGSALDLLVGLHCFSHNLDDGFWRDLSSVLVHAGRSVGFEHDRLDGVETLAHDDEHGLLLRFDGVAAATDADHLSGHGGVDVLDGNVFDGEAGFWVAFRPVKRHIAKQVLQRVVLNLDRLLNILHLQLLHT